MTLTMDYFPYANFWIKTSGPRPILRPHLPAHARGHTVSPLCVIRRWRRRFSRNRQSMPVPRKVSIASAGVFTMGWPLTLKLVFKTISRPVVLPTAGGRFFGNREINKEHVIVGRELLRAMEIIKRAFVIAFGHQSVAVVHQTASIARTLDHDVVPEVDPPADR